MRPCLARRLIALASAWASSRVTRPLAGGPLGGSSAHGGLYFGLAGRATGAAASRVESGGTTGGSMSGSGATGHPGFGSGLGAGFSFGLGGTSGRAVTSPWYTRFTMARIVAKSLFSIRPRLGFSQHLLSHAAVYAADRCATNGITPARLTITLPARATTAWVGQAVTIGRRGHRFIVHRASTLWVV